MIAPGEHEHYEHYDAAMVERLDRAWGRVDAAINRRVATLLNTRGRVLDLGCGFGSLASHLARSHPVIGVDPLLACLRAGARRYPATTLCGSACDLPFSEGDAEAVVFKDVLHHLVDEVPIERVFAELQRVGISRVVVVDPNPNPLLRAARRLIGHADPVCDPGRAVELLEAAGFRVEHLEYGVLYSLPLSGGYVGPVLLPAWRAVWAPLLWLEGVLSALLNRLRLARFVCWRYYIVASGDSPGGSTPDSTGPESSAATAGATGDAHHAGPSRANSTK